MPGKRSQSNDTTGKNQGGQPPITSRSARAASSARPAARSAAADGDAHTGGMTPLTGSEIRERFLRFFEERGHLRMSSSHR